MKNNWYCSSAVCTVLLERFLSYRMQEASNASSRLEGRDASLINRGGEVISSQGMHNAGGSMSMMAGRREVKVEKGSTAENDETGPFSQRTSESSDGGDPCPICLRRCEDEAKLDSCSHRFCFGHICEWISLNPVCPMCKRSVRKIMHNIRGVGANQICEEVTVEDLRNAAEIRRIASGSLQPMDSERREVLFMIRHLQRVIRDHDDMMARAEQANGRVSLEWRMQRQEIVSRCNRYQLLLDSFDRPRVLVIADPTFRLLVYERHLLRRPITEDDRTADGTRRRLSISPSFFTRREGEQRPRISLFVRRELAVLMQDTQHVDALVDRVYEAICNHQINSPFFTTILCRESDIRHSYADHFAQLLFEFAASGQDLHIFDANSEYISEDESRRRRALANRNRTVGNDVDDIQVHDQVINLDRHELASSATARPRLGRRTHNPFVTLTDPSNWSSHPINSRSSFWPNRSNIDVVVESDDSSVEILAEEPQSSSARGSTTSVNRSRRPVESDAWDPSADLIRGFRGTGLLFPDRRLPNGCPLGTWWNSTEAPVDDGNLLFSGQHRTIGEHLAMFRNVFSSLETTRESLAEPIQTPVITEIPNEVDHDVQDVADSESDDEEIYVHQECRLPTTNNVHAESLMDVDGGESDWQSSSTANAIWSTAGTSASHSAAATSTHPVHLPSNREGNSSQTACSMDPSQIAPNLVLIANVPVASEIGSNQRLKKTGARSVIPNNDEDVLQLDSSNELSVENDEVTVLDPPRASVPIITLDDDVEEVPRCTTSSHSTSSVAATSGGDKSVQLSSAEDRKRSRGEHSSLESSGADGGSSSRQRRRHRETSHRSQGPVTTIADLNDLLEDAFEGADVGTLAASASGDLIERAEARLRQGSKLLQSVRRALHSRLQISEGDAKQERDSGGEGTSRDADRKQLGGERESESKGVENCLAHRHSSDGRQSRHQHSSKRRRRGSSEDDNSTSELPSKVHRRHKQEHRKVRENTEEGRHRPLMEERNVDDHDRRGYRHSRTERYAAVEGNRRRGQR
uniref:RING-type E3 ubiquitin transferase n=1 Tax=Ascaris suum TaxID=6253 RepID=F1KTR7_ASCSU